MINIFECAPNSLKDFKELIPIGQKLRLVYAAHNGETDPHHKLLNLLREVIEKRTKDLVFKMLEGEKAGQLSYLEWPKAKEITFLCDDRGFYGFRIDSEQFNTSLVYHFEY